MKKGLQRNLAYGVLLLLLFSFFVPFVISKTDAEREVEYNALIAEIEAEMAKNPSETTQVFDDLEEVDSLVDKFYDGTASPSEEARMRELNDKLGLPAIDFDPDHKYTLEEIAGESGSSAGVNKEITNPAWFLGSVKFFNLGTTWADVIVAIAVLVMIFAAAYDILAFTAFESTWVKYSISAGVALVSAVVGVINALSVFLMGIVGGSVIFATIIAIGLAVGFFVISTFFKGKMKLFKARGKAMDAKAGYVRAANAIGGLKDIDTAAAKEKR